MKKIAIAALVASFSFSAFASGIGSPEANASASQAQGQIQGQAQGQLQGQAQSSYNSNRAAAGAAAGAYSGGNKQTQSGQIVNETDIRPAASAPGLSLTSVGTDNCLGSASASFGTGFFSIGGASTTESVECNRRAYSRALRELGQAAAALQLLCLNPEVASVTASCGKAREAASTVNSPLVSAGGKSRNYDSLVCQRTGERCE